MADRSFGGHPVKRLLFIVVLLLATPAWADTIIIGVFDNADITAVQTVVFLSQFPFGDTFDFVYLSGPLAGFEVLGDIPSAVPEPATWAMLLAGFAMLGGWSWRFKRSVQKS
jgi:hypothetical protein